MRIGCLYVHEFPLAARLRSDPRLGDQPVALVEGKGSHALVLAVVPSVWKSGVRAGFSLPQARALLPGVAFTARDPEAERAAQAALIETAEAFSPRVEEAGPGLVYLDMCNDANESALLERAVQRARSAGLRVRAAVADGKLAARVAAEEAEHGPIRIPPGKEAAYLAPLPVARLRPSDDILLMLDRWGIRTAGGFAGLPERDIVARLGKEGWDLHRASRGVDPRPLVPRAHVTEYVEGIELEWPVLDSGTFLGLSDGILQRLCARLAASDLAILHLRLRLKLDPLGDDARAIELPAPTRDVRSILDLLLLEIERTPPPDPIIGISFSVQPARPKRAQLSLFDPPALSPDALNAAISRIAAMVGMDRVGSPRAVDGQCPEAYWMEPFHEPPLNGTENRALFGRGTDEVAPPSLLSVRVLRPRVELDVRAQSGAPHFLRSVRNDGTRPEIVGNVRVASGPWRVEEGWWQGRPVFRDYWDVELSDGALYRVYHDSVADKWFADGIYD